MTVLPIATILSISFAMLWGAFIMAAIDGTITTRFPSLAVGIVLGGSVILIGRIAVVMLARRRAAR